MANRYWVGGAGTWDASSTTHWSTSSGGASGASVPSSGDAVIFDDNSGAAGTTVTLSGTLNCNTFSINRTATITLTGSGSINGYGTTFYTGATGITTLSGMTGWFNVYGDNSTFTGYAVFPNVLITAGVDSNLQYSVTTTITELKLIDNSTLTIKNTAYVTKITGFMNPTPFVNPIIRIGHSGNQTADLYVTGFTDCINGAINISSSYSGANLYIEPATGVCTMSLGQQVDTNSYVYAQFSKMTLKPLSAGASFTFGGIGAFWTNINKEAATASCVVKFVPSSSSVVAYYFYAWSLEGDVSNTVYIESSVSSTRATITKLSGGTVTTNYVEVKDMQPTPDNTWLSLNSTNAGNNYQWYFDDFDKPTSNLFFGNHL